MKGRPKTKYGKTVSFFLSDESIKQLNELALKNDKTRTDIIEYLINQRWNSEEN
jgi:predicted transcriptional regulator